MAVGSGRRQLALAELSEKRLQSRFCRRSVRVQQAEITGRVGGYENWKVSAVVIESFKGKLKKGDVIDYFHGAEVGLKREYFDGEKIVFLLSERDPKTKEIRYSVLENSTLQSTPDRLSKLRLIRRQSLKSRAGR